MKPRSGVDAAVLLKYGNHTADCSYADSWQCNCGWEKLKKAFEVGLPIKVSGRQMPAPLEEMARAANERNQEDL